MEEKQIIFLPSMLVKPLYTHDYYEADVWGGRGRGGSHGITEHAVYEMITQRYFRGYFCRAVQGSIRDSLWQDFKDRIDELSEINGFNVRKLFRIVDTKMFAEYIPNGNTIKSKGFRASQKANTAHMKSIAGATHVYIEECEEIGREEYNKLADSLRTTKGKIRIIRSWNSPPKEHWLVKDYYNLLPSDVDGYYRLESKGIKGHLSIYGDYILNLKNLDNNTVARYLRYKETQPRYYYNQIKGFVYDGGDKKTYYGWSKVTVEEFDEIDGVECYGIDFGDTSPTSLVHIKYIDGRFYRRELLYASLRSLKVKYGKAIKDFQENLYTENGVSQEEKYSLWGKHRGVLSYVFEELGVNKNIMMFCDPAQNGLIIELRASGYNAVSAKKDKKANINFINRADNYYTEDSENLEAEYDTNYLETDINKNIIDGKPIKGNDHALEAAEYGVRGLKDTYSIVL